MYAIESSIYLQLIMVLLLIMWSMSSFSLPKEATSFKCITKNSFLCPLYIFLKNLWPLANNVSPLIEKFVNCSIFIYWVNLFTLF